MAPRIVLASRITSKRQSKVKFYAALIHRNGAAKHLVAKQFSPHLEIIFPILNRT